MFVPEDKLEAWDKTNKALVSVAQAVYSYQSDKESTALRSPWHRVRSQWTSLHPRSVSIPSHSILGRPNPSSSGANAIWVHQTQPDGTLSLVKEVKSIREEDGPRHAVVSENGKCVYSVTEHSESLGLHVSGWS